jgi:2-dehydropantoate 2-reductase
MRIAVMGAGAVGCYYGGMLSRAGHQVMLIGRRQQSERTRNSSAPCVPPWFLWPWR